MEIENKRPHLAKWETVLVLLSLLVSIVSLAFSIYSARRTEKIGSSPNIQIVSSTGDRSHTIINASESLFSISGQIAMENLGSAGTQIINIKWEAIESGEIFKINEPWLAISDYLDPTSKRLRKYFYDNRLNPMLSIKDKTIRPGENKTLNMSFFAKNVLNEKHNIPTIRIIFTFNNGEERTVIPEIQTSSVGD